MIELTLVLLEAEQQRSDLPVAAFIAEAAGRVAYDADADVLVTNIRYLDGQHDRYDRLSE
jgi:hypothetical protein